MGLTNLRVSQCSLFPRRMENEKSIVKFYSLRHSPSSVGWGFFVIHLHPKLSWWSSPHCSLLWKGPFMPVPTRGEVGRVHPSISPNWRNRSLLIPAWCGDKSFLILLGGGGIHPFYILLVIPPSYFSLQGSLILQGYEPANFDALYYT